MTNLVDGHDLAIGFLDLLQLHQEVPEPRFCDNSVGSEDSHAEEFGGGV